jgi:glutathionyl-hydroquinone reductase
MMFRILFNRIRYETVNMDHIKKHYYRGHDSINPTRIVPQGLILDFKGPRGRERLSG